MNTPECATRVSQSACRNVWLALYRQGHGKDSEAQAPDAQRGPVGPRSFTDERRALASFRVVVAQPQRHEQRTAVAHQTHRNHAILADLANDLGQLLR